MIKAVAFDLDCTLFDREAAVRAMLPAQWQAFRERLNEITLDSYIEAWLELDDHGYCPKTELYETIVQRFGFSVSAQELLADFHSRYKRSFAAMPYALETLRELRSKGYPLAVVTNGQTEIQSAKIRSLAFEFDAVLISEAEGIRKPDPAMFLRAAERLKVQPRECAFVGDHPEVDIAGAAGAGMVPVWLRNEMWPEPTIPARVIANLSELALCVEASPG